MHENYGRKISGAKSGLWRLLGVIYLWIIAYVTLGSIPNATAITIVHHTVFLFVFFAQDRIWMRIEWGKEYLVPPPIKEVNYYYNYIWSPTKWRSFTKGFIYEIIIAIPILTLIGYVVTGDFSIAFTTSLIYTSSKIVLYQVYEQVFDKWILKNITQ